MKKIKVLALALLCSVFTPSKADSIHAIEGGRRNVASTAHEGAESG